MYTGKLTPRSNDTVKDFLFTGSFGQPDGFGSVLRVQIKTDGRACFTLTYKNSLDFTEHMWSVELDNEQRHFLAGLLGSYHPNLWHIADEK